MNPAAKLYRLPCSCSAHVVVVPGQAGGRVACPACGGAIDVPRLRELEAFVVTSTPPAIRPWQACQGWFLLGVATAVTAAAAAVFVGSRGLTATARLPDADSIRAAVDSVDAGTIYRAWQAMRFSGVNRGASPDEVRLQQSAGVAGSVGRMLWAVAALGGLLAAIAAMRCLATGRGPASDPRLSQVAKENG